MADETNTAPEQEKVESIPTPEAPAIVAQEAKTVGDDAMEVREDDIQVTQGTVPAQVAQPREGDSDVVHVHEVAVTTDTVITDPSDPLAVIIPDAGRGSLDLPIHRLDRGHVEAQFDKANAEAKKS